MSDYHIPVLLDPSVSALILDEGGIYADATFGGGGHTAEILSRLNDGGRVIAFDRDIDALENRPDDPRLTLIHNNFRFIENYAKALDVRFDGILADLGVSSHQLDTPERGFSFRYDAPLDMRMNTRGGMTAEELLDTASEAELARILKVYGEINGAAHLARLIVSAREKEPLRTTGDLCRALESALPEVAEHKFLAKVFQALRIALNGELRALEKFLDGAARSLRPGGRLVIITYHSLEDRMVKNFIRFGNVDGREEKDIFGRSYAPLEAVLRKPVVPEEAEIARNTRARSAKLRVARKREEEAR